MMVEVRVKTAGGGDGAGLGAWPGGRTHAHMRDKKDPPRPETWWPPGSRTPPKSVLPAWTSTHRFSGSHFSPLSCPWQVRTALLLAGAPGRESVLAALTVVSDFRRAVRHHSCHGGATKNEGQKGSQPLAGPASPEIWLHLKGRHPSALGAAQSGERQNCTHTHTCAGVGGWVGP